MNEQLLYISIMYVSQEVTVHVLYMLRIQCENKNYVFMLCMTKSLPIQVSYEAMKINTFPFDNKALENTELDITVYDDFYIPT